jgi:hypothetical protein
VSAITTAIPFKYKMMSYYDILGRSAILISKTGTVQYTQTWFDSSEMEKAIKSLLGIK